MSLYFTDQVEITPISRDTNFRTEIEGTPFLSKAYIEDESEIKYGSDGQPLDPVMFIGLPVNTSIVKGDFIEITKLHGKAIEQQSTVIDTSKNLIGLWRCDEGNGLVATDESQYKNHGILEGTAPSWIDGKSGKAIYLPGTDERLNCRNPYPLNQLGNGSFWIPFWMKSKDFSPLAYGALFFKYQDSTNQIYLSSNSTQNRIRLYIAKSGIAKNILFSISSAPFDTIWNHVVLVINRITDKALLYINTAIDGVEGDLSGLPADVSNSANVSWGGRDTVGYPDARYEGGLDEMRLYTGIPTQNDIDVLHDNPGAPIKSTIRTKSERRKVKKVIEVGSFGMSHIEVYV
jgi:hypothetical protein